MSVTTTSGRWASTDVAQRVGVSDGVDDVDLAGLDEQPAGALADEVVVLGKDDGDHVLAPLVTAGRWQRTTVPPSVRPRRRWSRRWRRPGRPCWSGRCRERWPSIPTPSSTTSIASPASQRRRTHTRSAAACLATFVRASLTTNHAVALDRRVEALGGDRRLDVDGDVEREAGGPLLEGDDEAVVGEHLREDAVDEVTDLAERAGGCPAAAPAAWRRRATDRGAAGCGPASPWR